MSPATVAARREAGLCIDCGAERTGDGITKLRCARCSERVRTAARAWYEKNRDRPRPKPDLAKKRTREDARADARRDADLCPECGKPRDPSGETRLCKRCRERSRKRCAAYRQRKRNEDEPTAVRLPGVLHVLVQSPAQYGQHRACRHEKSRRHEHVKQKDMAGQRREPDRSAV